MKHTALLIVVMCCLMAVMYKLYWTKQMCASLILCQLKNCIKCGFVRLRGSGGAKGLWVAMQLILSIEPDGMEGSFHSCTEGRQHM
jgi:hypothetical protein